MNPMTTDYEFRIEKSFHFYKGRVALQAILRAMGIGHQDEVIVPGFTCLAVPLPVLSLGAIPVYADISEDTYNMTVDGFEKLVSPKTKAIVVQHTYGIPVETESIVAWARRKGIYVIEDCCHTLSSTFNGRRVGTVGDAAFYSYEWGKPLVLGSGGSAVVNDAFLEEKLGEIYATCAPSPHLHTFLVWLQRKAHALILTPSMFWRLRGLFRFLGKFRFVVQTFTRNEVEGKMEHGNTKMAGFLQKRLHRDLKQIAADNMFRNHVVQAYEEGLRKIGVKGHQRTPGCDIVYLRYPLLVRDKALVSEIARRKRIEIGDWFTSPVHPLLEDQLERVQYRKGSCPVAEFVSQRIITLPIYRKVDNRTVKRTITFLAELKQDGLL